MLDRHGHIDNVKHLILTKNVCSCSNVTIIFDLLLLKKRDDI